MFKTNKCTHGDKGMCIHCMISKSKQQPKVVEVVQAPFTCKHPTHMKCIRCLPKDQKKSIYTLMSRHVQPP